MAWQGMDPRLEGHMIALTGGLNRWFLRHPIRGPVICFIVTIIFIGLSFIPGMGRLIYLAIFPFLIGLFLLIYTLLRRASEPSSTINYDQMDEPPEEYTEVDEWARQQAVEKWRRRARQDSHQRRNSGG